MRTKFTEKDNLNSGLALVLIILMAGLGWHVYFMFKILVPVVLLLMINPIIFYPFTFLWLNLSDLLGKIMSKIILCLVFFLIVCPTAFIRKLSGKDTLHLKIFKNSEKSIFTERNHSFSKDDLINPY